MKFGLDEKTIEKINLVFAKFPNIDEVLIYGSRAKGNFREASDIDLSLKGENIDFALLSKVDNALDDLLLPYKFDLSIFSKLENPEFIDHINRVGIIFYKKK